MSCCCEKVYRLCNLHVCREDLILPIPVSIDGEHTLRLEFLGQSLEITADLSNGDNVTFATEDLNERFTYIGQVLDPDGTVMRFTVNDVEYDCFEFTTKSTLPYADNAS